MPGLVERGDGKLSRAARDVASSLGFKPQPILRGFRRVAVRAEAMVQCERCGCVLTRDMQPAHVQWHQYLRA